jgi:hypothetical protein
VLREPCSWRSTSLWVGTTRFARSLHEAAENDESNHLALCKILIHSFIFIPIQLTAIKGRGFDECKNGARTNQANRGEGSRKSGGARNSVRRRADFAHPRSTSD